MYDLFCRGNPRTYVKAFYFAPTLSLCDKPTGGVSWLCKCFGEAALTQCGMELTDRHEAWHNYYHLALMYVCVLNRYFLIGIIVGFRTSVTVFNVMFF